MDASRASKNEIYKKMGKYPAMTKTPGKIKKTGKFQGKSNKLGGGGRFKQMVAQGKSPALAAYIGRKSLGKAKFQKLAAAGRKRASKKA